MYDKLTHLFYYYSFLDSLNILELAMQVGRGYVFQNSFLKILCGAVSMSRVTSVLQGKEGRLHLFEYYSNRV